MPAAMAPGRANGLYVVVVGEEVCRPFLREGHEAPHDPQIRLPLEVIFCGNQESELRDSKQSHTPGSALECTSRRQSGHFSFIIGLVVGRGCMHARWEGIQKRTCRVVAALAEYMI